MPATPSHLKVFIAPLNGGDAVEGSVLYGFHLFAEDGEEIASGFTVEGKNPTPTPEELVNAIPHHLFHACPFGKRITVLNTLMHIWFRFERTDAAEGVRFVDREGNPIAPPA